MTPKSTEKTGNPSNPASPGRRRRAGPLSRWRQVRFLDVFFATLPLVAIAVFVFGAACLDYQRISQYDDWWSNATSVRKFGWYRVRAALRQPRASVLRAEIAPEDPERATVRLRVDRAEFDELSSDVAGSWGQWIDATISTPSRELAAELRFRGDGSAHWTSEKKSLSIKTGKDELYRGFRRLNFTLKDVLPQYVVNSLAQDFDLLAQTLTEVHIRQQALDRSPMTSTATLGLSRPLTPHLQLNVNANRSIVDAMPASGDAPASPEAEYIYFSTDLVSSSLFREGDVGILSLRYATSDSADTYTMSLDTRFPIGRKWRINPRLRVDYREVTSDMSTQWTYTPGLRLQYRLGRRGRIELDTGKRFSSRDMINTDLNQDQESYFINLGYQLYY